MSGSLRILVVESDEPLCAQIVKTLRAAGHQVDVARSGREALLLAAQARYERLVLNPALPDITGILLFLMLRGIDPELPRRTLFVSGARAGPAPLQELSGLGLGCLSRHFASEDLLARLS